MKKSYIGILFLLLMIFGLFFATIASNGFCLGDYLLHKVGLKAWQNDEEKMGLRYTFFYGLLFVVIGWRGAVDCLKEDHPYLVRKMPGIFLALFIFIVPAVTEYTKNTYYSYQKGLNVVEYQAKESECNVNTEGEKQKVTGTIILTNHGKEELKVSIKLINNEFFIEDLALKDNNNQSVFVLQPEKKNCLDFNFLIDKGKGEFDSGNMTAPKIRLEQI
ncbi:hypothetical protein JCM14036_01180 [Desulfotomaculum defluvii]